jgi:hypothetical protein
MVLERDFAIVRPLANFYGMKLAKSRSSREIGNLGTGTTSAATALPKRLIVFQFLTCASACLNGMSVAESGHLGKRCGIALMDETAGLNPREG